MRWREEQFMRLPLCRLHQKAAGKQMSSMESTMKRGSKRSVRATIPVYHHTTAVWRCQSPNRQEAFFPFLTVITSPAYDMGVNAAQLLHIMDRFLAQGERLMRAVCDLFAADLAFVRVSDDATTRRGLTLAPDLFEKLFAGRMRRLITPVLAVPHSGGALAPVLPGMHVVAQ